MSEVLRLVGEQGWIDASGSFDYCVNFSRGACLSVRLMREGHPGRHVKFSLGQSLAHEALRSKEASIRFPNLAPEFVGYVQAPGLEILVSNVVEALGVTRREALHSGRGASLLRCLDAYFEAAARLDAVTMPLVVPNRQLGDSIATYFRTGPFVRPVERWLSGGPANLALALPDIPQHGDFVLNNIGRRIPSGVAIFDWEDFGESALPGLDLFTFEISLAEQPVEMLRHRQREADTLTQLKQRACRSLGLTLAEYHALTPIYALVFRYLKRTYGPGVRERMDRLLLTLSQQS
ncbi:MAG: hypothetical protein IPM15_13305 [Betaproteobacteria bacterium]|nr:hypothetical protein [Betaproteobacteria bacterium]